SSMATGSGGLGHSPPSLHDALPISGLASASASFGGDDDHTGGSDSAGFTIDKAASTVAVTCPSVHPTFTSSAIEPCSAKATGAGGLNQPLAVSYSGNVHAGTATASASYAGDADHTGNTDSTSFAIDKAGSTATVTCPTADQVYTGSAIEPCSAKAIGAGGLNATLVVSYSSNVNV